MTEAQWLAQIAAGGRERREGVGALYGAYASRLKAYFQRRGASHADADELCQDSFVRIVKALDGGTEVTEPRAWIWTVARSQWLDWQRRQRPDTVPIEEWTEPQAEASPDPDLADCVRRQLSLFADAHPEGAQVLVWASVEQFTAPEISQLIGRTVGATRQWLTQLRKQIRSYLEVCHPH